MKRLKNALKENRYDIFTALYIFFSLMARYVSCGFKYFPQLDDYIQYGRYPNAPDVWNDVVIPQGLLAARPLAGLSDVYFWGKMFNFMLVAVALICVLYAISAILFLKVFRTRFKTGVMFTFFYSLMPFFFEGAYWMSASTRVVVGLFFVSLSVFLLQKHFDTSKRGYFPAFCIVQLISLCYYEQVFILSLVLNFTVILLNCGKSKRSILCSVPLAVNSIIYFAFSIIFSNSESAIGKRIMLELPAWNEWYFNFITDVFTQLKTVFWDAPMSITFRGFGRGLLVTVTNGLWVLIPIAAIIGAATYLLCKHTRDYKEKNEKAGRTVLCAIILAVLPVSLFLVIANPYICMRNILTSFVGIAIVLDMIFAALIRRKKALMCAVAAAISVVFFFSGISEMHDYKAVYEFDQKIAARAKDIVNGGTIENKAAFIIDEGDRGTVNIRFHEHGAGVISSDWALWGLLNYINPGALNSVTMPIEVKSDHIYHVGWNKDVMLLTNYSNLYYWNNDLGDFVPVTLRQISDTVFELVAPDGGVVATVKEHYSTGYILFN